ncbi:DoxX family protein [Cellulomonas sp. NPDC089187]|uniref:DoxX family protein n=1 Tax=Cellulomonas sp. NPDC089187 TaxID=3154970 RepID=UPI00342B9BF5
MLLRRIARPLFASWFLAEGVDALRHPQGHVATARTALDRLDATVPADLDLDDATLTTVVRAHGAATAVAAGLLTLGKLPRLSGAALALLTLPLALAELAVDKEHRGPKRERRQRLLRPLALTGGALIVAADTHGKPSVRWRVEHAKAVRAAAAKTAQAREALTRG